jgi:two-component system, chemotaxis family, protein-glutamate methylesterase/glutaminase
VQLNEEAKVRFSRPAADPLFHSATDVYGPRVIGVVLTGGDGDGTEGLRAIKAAGGIGVVQDPKEAKAPEMPLTALVGDSPDFKVVLSEMAPLLMQLVTVSE